METNKNKKRRLKDLRRLKSNGKYRYIGGTTKLLRMAFVKIYLVLFTAANYQGAWFGHHHVFLRPYVSAKTNVHVAPVTFNTTSNCSGLAFIFVRRLK